MLERGAIVLSLSGRDKGRLLAVVEGGEKSVRVCDGKERPVERPKLKNIRHLEPTGKRLGDEELKTNRALKKALSGFNASGD